MNTKDVKPSRLIQAKQKVEDLLNLSQGLKIGLIAFAADPHMIAPITDDKEMIRHILPSLNTNLVYVQGSRLSSALEMASNMLHSEPGNNKAVLVISDGGFEDASAIVTARKLAEKGLQIHTMGIGTLEGARLHEKTSGSQKNPYSKLEKERLHEISNAGHGKYLEGHSYDNQETFILRELEKRANARESKHKHFLWDEYFYLMVLPALAIVLVWFRKGYLFAATLLLLFSNYGLEAGMEDYFKNSEEMGRQALDDGNYQEALSNFQDPYRKGVACYRAGNFAEAEKMFIQSSRGEVACQAAYNLGNTLAQQHKLKEAVTAYEHVLQCWPDHLKAKENLALVKKMLEEQQQENSKSDSSDHNQDPEESSENSHDGDNSQSDEQQKNENSDHNQDQKESNEKSHDDDHAQSDKQQKNENSSNDSVDEKREDQKEAQEESDQKNNETDTSQPNDETQPTENKAEQQSQQAKTAKSQEEQDADLWLNQITNDPKTFLKNKFYLESKGNGTKEGIDPW